VRVYFACRVLGVSTWSGYQAIKRGDFPVRTIPVGRRIVVPTAPLRKILGLEGEPTVTAPPVTTVAAGEEPK
jgi:hypothetical protein